MPAIEKSRPQLEWVGAAPWHSKRAALLIPQYNEASNCDFEARLHYFRRIAEDIGGEIDVILIDDGSTDDSLVKIQRFSDKYDCNFFVAAVRPNANKVGALHLAVQQISHDFVILSDFDTDITGYSEIIAALGPLKHDPGSMGFYFRMLPHEGDGHVFTFQQLEYATLRTLYKFYRRDGSVPVMPGTGACYKRAELLAIYRQHSGLRSGEDREATTIGLKLGFKTSYRKDILTLTRPPLTLKALIKQRVRWNLGYLETCQKEKRYYRRQVKHLSRIGIIFLLDLLSVLFMVTLPVAILVFGIISLKAMGIFLAIIYLAIVLVNCCAILSSPEEFTEIRRGIVLPMLFFPIQKMVVGNLSWLKAIDIFKKKQRRQVTV